MQKLNLIRALVEDGDGFTFAGFKLKQELDVEPDNRKIFHYITDLTGKQHWLDHDPYEWLDREALEAYVKFFKARGRFPTRDDVKAHGPLDNTTIKRLVSSL